jgi:tyrosyl-tRNA synthetase
MENKKNPNENEKMSNRAEAVDQILNRGVIVNILPDKESFRQRLLSLEPMKIYIGVDPTSTTLHLSHAKNYMLLEEFRKLGHEVIVLFGDFTARIGDPTGKLTARKQLTREDVMKNVQGWIKQIKPLMDFEAKDNPPKIVYNNDWLSKLTMEDVVNLASNVTVQQMIERDMFAKRLKEEQPIYLHEFMYPIMQGYDSVALGVDAELCGTDQTFNALVGRTLLKKFKQKEKFVVAVNLMENPLTHELMSKSRGTGVFLDLDPFNMYGAIMSQPDEMIKIFLINNTRIPLDDVEIIIKMENLRDAKMRAAFEITKIFHGENKANEAQDKFIKLVQKKEPIDAIPQVKIGYQSVSLSDLLKKCMPEGTSGGEIRRLLEQNAVEIDGDMVKEAESIINIPVGGLNLKVGKKKWFKVVP